MSVFRLLFGFQGRINRAQYWLGAVGMSFGAILLVTLLLVLGGLPSPALSESQQVAHFLGVFTLALIPTLLVVSWIGYALSWKRCHDRNKSGVWMMLPMLPSFMMFASVFGAISTGASPGALEAASQPWAAILWAMQLWFFIDLGCLPGTNGPNKYGNAPSGLSGGAPSTGGAPFPGAAKQAPPAIPGMGSALIGAESAIDRAIAAQGKPQRRQPAPAPSGALRTATATSGGSFGRKAPR